MSFYLIMLILLWRKKLNLAIPVFFGLAFLGMLDQLLLGQRGNTPGVTGWRWCLYSGMPTSS